MKNLVFWIINFVKKKEKKEPIVLAKMTTIIGNFSFGPSEGKE
jgi:hypothetical protein